MGDVFDPYYIWLGIPPSQQPPHWYRLLGLEVFEDDPVVIDGAADRQMSHLRTFQNSPRADILAQLLNDVAAARATLLDAEKKLAYDERLRKKLKLTAGLKIAHALPEATPTDQLPPLASSIADQPGLSIDPAGGKNSGGLRKPVAASKSKAKQGIPIAVIGGVVAGAAILGIAGYAFVGGGNRSPTKPVARKQLPENSPDNSAPVAAPNSPMRNGTQTPPSVVPGESSSAPPKDIADKTNVAPPESAQNSEKNATASGNDPPAPANSTQPVRSRSRSFPPELVFYASLDGKEGDPFTNLVTGEKARTSGSPKRVPGKRGQAVEFDGKSYLDFGDCCRFNHSDQFSFGCWVIFPVLNHESSILGRLEARNGEGGSDMRGYDLFVSGRDTLLMDCVQSHRGGNWMRIDAKGVTLVNTWHHLFVVHKSGVSANSTAIYVDGHLREVDAPYNSLAKNQTIIGKAHFTIGSRDQGDYPLRGLIDEPQVYRRALTDAEIALLASGQVRFIGKPDRSATETEAAKSPKDPSSDNPKEAMAEPPASDDDSSGLARIPTADQLKSARDDILAVFRKDIAEARTPDQKVALSVKLLSLAGDEAAGSASQYALVVEARNLAVAAGDISQAWSAIESLARSFAVDKLGLRREAISSAIVAGVPVSARKNVIDSGVFLTDELLAREDFVAAGKLLGELTDLARTVRDTGLSQAIAERRKRGADAFALFKSMQPAIEKLKTAPDDAESHLAVGKYLCLGKSDWDHGLAHLARGANESWAAAAKAELASPATIKDKFAVAELWLALAAANPKEKIALQQRAAMWYTLGKENAAGLDKILADKKLAELPSPAGMHPASGESPSLGELRTKGLQATEGEVTTTNALPPHAVYLDDLDESDAAVAYGRLGKHGESGFIGNEDERVYITYRGVPIYNAIAAHPPDNGEAFVAYQLGGRYERFAATAVLWHPDHDPPGAITMSVVGDGRVLWKSERLTKKESQVTCSVDIQGVRTLRLVVACEGINYYAHAAWLRPMLFTKENAAEPESPRDSR